MKMDGVVVAVAVAMAIIALSGNGPQGAEAQGVTCQSTAGASAPVTDANAVVEDIRQMNWGCCHSGSGDCTPVTTSGNAAITLCGSQDYCLPCTAVGDGLNLVLAQCNVQSGSDSEVQGVYSPDGVEKFYLTSVSGAPN